METLYLLIPVALIIAFVAVKLLWWAINNGQYDDLDTESQRILFDDNHDNVAGSVANNTAAKASAKKPRP